jgi:cysteinyl-tRNA synthetase
MALKVFNTLSKEKEKFVPVSEGKVGMYVCGVTPYDYCHMGHGRCYTSFDILRRYLSYRGYTVKYIQNFTDIDDKIIERAAKANTDPFALSKKFSDEYFADMDRLGILRAYAYPLVTQTIPDIIKFIERLKRNGYAYAVEGEHGSGKDVYYEVPRFVSYGKLSGQPLEKLRAGARIGMDERKKNYEDFALWKSAKPGEPSWDSPWGRGRPGWHIECSVMSTKYLGDTLDIHGGGQDLIFPHHEDEIAQSEAATGKPCAKYWLHNGFVVVGNDKMAKSLGNFVTLRQALDSHGPRLMRLFYAYTHYRAPIDSDPSRIEELRPTLQKLLDTRSMLLAESRSKARPEEGDSDAKVNADVFEIVRKFEEAMDDDFNTPLAIAALFELKDFAYSLSQDKSASRTAFAILHETYEKLANGVLGLFDAEETKAEISDAEISKLVAQRDAAKKAADYAKADAIRAQLKEKGILLTDSAKGATWKKAA